MAASEFLSNETKTELIIRRATSADIPALSQLGSKLIKQHQAYDAQRFSVFEPLAEKYAQFLAEQIENDSAIVLVAELSGNVCGYAFVRVEPDSFLEALAEAAWLHDIYVEETARGANVGKKLLQATMTSARELGSSCLMLSVSPYNEIARTLFQQAGFRPTMLEMRLDFESKG